MTAPWYSVGGAPAQRSNPNSSLLRAEFAAIETAMDKLPTFSGHEKKPVIVNSDGTALVASTALAVDISIGAGADVSPSGAGAGQLRIDGSGYSGYIALDADAMYLGHNSGSRDLEFQTNETSWFRIDATGRIALGADGVITTVDVAVRGSTATSGRNAFGVYNSAADVLLIARNDGLINTGTRANSPYNLTTASAANMHVTSDGNLARSTSSIKYKRDVSNYIAALPKIRQLRPVRFRSKEAAEGRPDVDGARWFAGLIAEEVHDAGLEEFVEYDSKGLPDAVMYSHLVALSLRGIQELDSRITALEARPGGGR